MRSRKQKEVIEMTHFNDGKTEGYQKATIENSVELSDGVKTGNIEIDEPIVEEAFQYLRAISVKHSVTKLEAGKYFIKLFYNGDYKKAEEKKFKKNVSLRQLFLKIKNDGSGDLPNKTWLYDAINLAIDENKYQKLSAYGKLGVCHKVKLTNTRCLPENIKRELIKETAKEEYTVMALQKRISQEKKKLNGDISLTDEMKIDQLQVLDTDKLKGLKNKIEKRFKKIEAEMDLHKSNLSKIDTTLNKNLKGKINEH